MDDTPHFSAVSIRDIAKRLSVSPSTVSRALREDPRFSAKTIERVKATAKKMGYRPNPMIHSLMAAHKTGRRRQQLKSNLCWFNSHQIKSFWHDKPYTKHLLDAAQERAHELGYGFEEIWALEPGLSAERLHQIIHSRYIHGLLIPTPVKALEDLNFNWENLAVVCLRDIQDGQLDWHRCSPASRENTQLAFERLRSLGYQRIALAGGICLYFPDTEKKMLLFNQGEACSHDLGGVGMRAMIAGFTGGQAFIPESERIPPFLFDNEPEANLKPVADWLKRVRPDAVICNGRTIFEAVQLAGLKVPDEIAIAHLNLDDDVSDWAGIDQHSGRQARSAVDMLCAQIERNERGLPPFPKFMHIKGEWRDGWTAPSK